MVELPGRDLRIAAGDQQHRLGIDPLGTAAQPPAIAGRARGNHAAIDHIKIGDCLEGHDAVAQCFELLAHLLALKLVELAAQSFDRRSLSRHCPLSAAEPVLPGPMLRACWTADYVL